MKRKTDFLVIGTGVAGISFALKVAEFGTVTLITKTKISETNTSYAQGGIAAVTDQLDSYEKHIEDTLVCGDGLCNEKIVRMVVNEAPLQIQQLVEWGTNFDKKPNGEFDLNKEGGHSKHRILHHKDNTGFEIQRALSEAAQNHPRIKIYEDYLAIDLITQHHLGIQVTKNDPKIACFGAYALNIKTNHIDTILAKATCLATGGVGSVYLTTTNPMIATGDGIAMVHRAKGEISGMEFLQFHPTALYNPNERPSFLITEAMRGFGAVLRNAKGQEFMHKYDQRGSLAPRDIVARAIDHEMKMRGDDFVYLDATGCDKIGLESHFPNIIEKCKSMGINIFTDYIPVIPAAHYLCGGVKVDENACTSIKQLYAIGEVANTGLHGANRLASNSLIEAVVLANRGVKHATKSIKPIRHNDHIPEWDEEGTSHAEEMILITQEMKELQSIMSNYVGIVRSNLRLKRALDRLQIIFTETEDLYSKSTLNPKLCELRNAVSVAYLIISQARKRKESRGLHFTIDYPEKYKI